MTIRKLIVDTTEVHCKPNEEGIAGATLEKDAATTAKCMRYVPDPDIKKRGTGDNSQLGVTGVQRTKGFRPRASESTVACADTIHLKQPMESLTRASAIGQRP